MSVSGFEEDLMYGSVSVRGFEEDFDVGNHSIRSVSAGAA